MNETDVTRGPEPKDEEILSAVRWKLGRVEDLVPLPPAWRPGDASEHARASRNIHSRAGWSGGLAALVVVAALLIVVIGPLGRFGAGPATTGPTPSGPRRSDSAVPFVRIDYQAQPDSAGNRPNLDQLAATADVMTSRLAATGIADVAVRVQLPDRIGLTMPKVSDYEALTAQAAVTGKVEFVPLPVADYGTGQNPGRLAAEYGKPLPTAEPTLFTGSTIDPASVRAGLDQATGAWTVYFTLVSPGKELFAQWTEGNVGHYLAITLDGVVLSAPFIQAPILDGSVQIGGLVAQVRAQNVGALLKFGALPFAVVKVGEEEIEGPSSGPASGGPVLPTSKALPSLATPALTIPSGLEDGQTLGRADAPVTIDLWTDFQCPGCGAFFRDGLPGLIRDYVETGKAKIVLHDFIVIDSNMGGTESRDAAVAARAAGRQGRYWEFALLLMTNQHQEASGWLNATTFEAIAARLGLDLAQFEADRADPTLMREVSDSTAAAASLGVQAAPAVAVNGHPIAGGTTLDQIVSGTRQAVENALTARPSAEPTTLPTAVPTASGSSNGFPSGASPSLSQAPGA